MQQQKTCWILCFLYSLAHGYTTRTNGISQAVALGVNSCGKLVSCEMAEGWQECEDTIEAHYQATISKDYNRLRHSVCYSDLLSV
jgi:hypothetical protein